MSAWLRYLGISQFGRQRAFGLTLTVDRDSNHVQPFVIVQQPDMTMQLSDNIALVSYIFPLPIENFSLQYWSKYTMTYQTDGVNSNLNFYINGTFIKKILGNGAFFRFSHNGYLILGNISYFFKFVILVCYFLH